MDFLKLGLEIVTYFVIGVLVAKITLAVQGELREQNGDEALDDDTRLGIAGLVAPLWPVFLGVLVLYLALALVMNLFSRLMRPFI